MKKKRVVVGLSGGVDSSVAAYLLKKQGYEVIAIFMKNWHDDSVTISKECPWLEDSNDAMIVANKLDIPFQVIDLSKEYKSRIVDYMFAEYKNGRTPNPDILCNREIKFDIFLKTALKLGADYVATGHYCRKSSVIVDGQEYFRLLSGRDNNKDQSYFLCQLSQDQLSRALFPIGELTKPEVREIAREQGLVTAEKRDSQGLCFIGKVKLPEFLQQQLAPKTGDVIEIPVDSKIYGNGFDRPQGYRYSRNEGIKVGEHPGAHYFTIGQRKGLNIGGKEKPLFVIDKDTIENIIYTGQGEDHPGLSRSLLMIKAEDIHWIRPDKSMNKGDQYEYLARIRYRQPLSKAILYRKEDHMLVEFDKPQKAIAAGQFIAWYEGDELVGSGIIS